MDPIYNIYKQGVGMTYTSPIFGPVHSRRLGLSLGINLLPGDGKWCSFDCIYCECGLNRDKRAKLPLPTRVEVGKALEQKLVDMAAEGLEPDVLTFAGNGEPTLNPEFAAIVDDVLALRDKYCPGAKVSVLTNSTQIHRDEVRKALMRIDNPIMKLDTVDFAYIGLVDQPCGNYSVERIVELLAEFGSKAIIQTMFMTGVLPDGTSVDNTGNEFVEPYIEALKRIAPRRVMIYTIDRETPVHGLQKAGADTLDSIAERISRETGIDVSVSY